jgi:hypothetical protein
MSSLRTLFLTLGVGAATTGIFVQGLVANEVDLGASNPPTVLGGYAMTEFSPDSADLNNDLSLVPVGGLGINWGEGYTGSAILVLAREGGITLTFAPGAEAVDFYIEAVSPGTFELNIGSINSSEAEGFGFYAAGSGSLGGSLTIAAYNPPGPFRPDDFYIGDFGINGGTFTATTPEVGSTFCYLGLALVCLIVVGLPASAEGFIQGD